MQGKLNPQGADLSIDTVKNAFYLVLISENFVEARAALSHSATNLPQTTQSPVKVDRATVAPSLPVTGQPLAPVPSGFSSDRDLLLVNYLAFFFDASFIVCLCFFLCKDHFFCLFSQWTYYESATSLCRTSSYCYCESCKSVLIFLVSWRRLLLLATNSCLFNKSYT